MPDIYTMGVQYEIPGMEQASVQKDLVYKQAGERELKFDLYRPANSNGTRLPVVIFVHGESRPDWMEFAKDWGQYVSWGRLAAASGLVGITFTHRAMAGLTKLHDAGADVDDLVQHIRRNAEGLGIDAERIGIWVCSAGGPLGLTTALRDRPPYVRCIVSYYAMMNLQHLTGWLGGPIPDEVSAEIRREYSPPEHLRTGQAIPPTLIIRAGQDQVPQLNDSIDHFVSEALARNHPIWVVNAPDLSHGFDVRVDSAAARQIIGQSLGFLQAHLADQGNAK